MIALESAVFYRKNDAFNEVVLFVVFGVVLSFEIIAKKTGKCLVETGTQFPAQFVHKDIRCASRFAVDEFEQYLALRDGTRPFE